MKFGGLNVTNNVFFMKTLENAIFD